MDTDLATLCSTINVLLRGCAEEYALAKKAMGIRPNVDTARKHAKLTYDMLQDLAELIIRAQNSHGITQPPDVVRLINRMHEDVMVLIEEIDTCELVTSGLEHRRHNTANLN